LIRPGARTLGRTGARARVGAYFARNAIFDRTTKQTRTPNTTIANSQFPNFLLFNTLGGQKLDWYKVCNFGQLNGSKGKYIGSVRSDSTPAFWGAKKTSPHYNQQAAELIFLEPEPQPTNRHN
jgi:hypothetical protein